MINLSGQSEQENRGDFSGTGTHIFGFLDGNLDSYSTSWAIELFWNSVPLESSWMRDSRGNLTFGREDVQCFDSIPTSASW